MAQQGWRTVENHQVDPVAADIARQRGNELPDGLLDLRGSCDPGFVDQNRDVDVAVGTFRAASPAAEQPGDAHHRLGA